MARAENAEIIDRFEEFYRSYYRNEIGELAQKYPGEQKSLYIDWGDLYRFDPDMADDFIAQPQQMQEYAEEALRLYDLPVDVKLGSAHVRVHNLSDGTGIRDIRADHVGNLVAVQGIVRKATDVRPKMRQAAFECQRCGTMTRIPQSDGEFQEPHECQGCERQGPFAINFDQSEFVDAQKIRVQESPEGLRGGETPQAIDVNIEDDITGNVTAGDHVTVVGILRLEQQGSEQEKSAIFDFYMDGMTVTIEDEQFEEMDITEEDKKRIIELSNDPDIYEKMVTSMAPSIYGYEKQKKAIILQLFSGVRKNLPDGSRIRGDLHILLIGDPGTGKCVSGDTRVTLADGSEVEIRDLVESNLDDATPIDDGVYDEVDIDVPSMAADGTLTTQRATKVWKREAPDRMYRIRTRTGREVVVTPSHPLFAARDGGMEAVVADDLTEGEFIATPRSLPTEGDDTIDVSVRRSQANNAVRLDTPEELTPQLARLVGYVVAEGYIQCRENGSGAMYVTNNDREILDDVSDALDKLDLNWQERSPHDDKQAREIVCSSSELVSFFDALEPSLLAESADQRVPDPVLRASQPTKRGFIRAFVDSEGSVNATQRSLSVASTSRELLEEVRSLLLSFEINSQLQPKAGGSYRLRISGTDFERYVDAVGFITDRKRAAAETVRGETANTNRDVIPNVGRTVRELREQLNLTQSECGLLRTTYQHYERGDRNPSRESLQTVIEAFAEAAADHPLATDGGEGIKTKIASLRALTDGDIAWDRIDAIEPVEPDDDWVYDLEIEGTHNYLTNNVVSHNSQILQYVKKLSPRSVYTSGKGSSSAGLCVTGDTQIHTADGFREIRDIVTSNLPEPVDTETAAKREIGVGTFDRDAGAVTQRASSHVWRMPEKPCRRIETSHGKELEASVNTPVLTCGENGIEWKEIADIDAGDYVAVPRYGDVNRPPVPVREFLELTAEKVKLDEASVAFCRERLTAAYGSLRDAAADLDLSEAFIYDSLKNRHVPLEKLDRILDGIDAAREDVAFERLMLRRGDSITVPEVFDEDLLYLLGLVFGDGDIRLDRRDGNRGCVRISNGNEALLRRAADIFAEKFDKRPEIERQADRVPCIRVHSATIARLFANAGMRTPKADLALHPTLTTAEGADAFVRGLMDADGSVSTRDNGGSSVLLSTISERLAEQLQLILETYGVRARTRERDRRGKYEREDSYVIESKHTQHFLELYGVDIDRYADAIGFGVSEKQAALETIREDATRRGETVPVAPALATVDGPSGQYYQNFNRGDNPGRGRATSILADRDLGDVGPAVAEAVEADLRWDEVVAAIDTGKKEVFDLTVPETHNFVGNGVVTHNTAAAVRDDFGEGQQWTLEAGALVLADQGVAAIDELDKMRCVTGDTLVHLGDGGVRRIRAVAAEAATAGTIEPHANGRTIRGVELDVWTMADDGRIVKRPVTAIHEYEAPSQLTEVTLATGERLTTTDDHPFFVREDGERVERAASDLEADDWVYVPRSIPTEACDGGTEVRSEEAEAALPAAIDSPQPAFGAVLGYLSGDGNVYSSRTDVGHGIRFTNAEEELRRDFEEACKQVFEAEPTRPPSDQREDGVETVHVFGKAAAKAVLEAGMNLEAYDGKAFPAAVSTGSRATKAAFLQALADSEGNVDTATGNVRIFSASYELLLGAKELLLEFGITGQLQHEERPDGRDIHTLAITDASSLEAFARHIGFTLDRKRQALETVVENVSGDRTILDVIPQAGRLLSTCREQLRLYQSECGLPSGTYCSFENGEANLSFHRGERVLAAFRRRRRQANEDLATLNEADTTAPLSWEELEAIKDRYHVSQADLAEPTAYSQSQISTRWGSDAQLRATVHKRLAAIMADVAETDLSDLRELVSGGVMWRRVDTVQRVSAPTVTDRIPVIREELADILAVPPVDAIEQARTVLATEPTLDTWDTIRDELQRHNVSFTDIATDLGVDGSTVSRWFAGVVDTARFADVRAIAEHHIADVRTALARRVDTIDAARTPRVYDLTVEGTHNFIANGMVVHNSEDQSAMHQALEQQEISISKAGINATLKSRCSLLGAANPVHGRFDEYEPMAEQIDLDPPLISRFDLIFTVTDTPDEEEDRALAEHIIETNYAGELLTHRESVPTSNVSEAEVDSVSEDVEPTIETELLRKYVAYAKRNCYPTMTEEAKATIRDFYVDLRLEGQGENNPIPVTARKLEALVRLAEASARVRLSDTVEQEDAERVIGIVRSSLEDVGIDPETGELDADIIESGTSKTQRDRIKNIKGIINELEDEYEDGAPIEEVYERAEAVGMERAKAEHEIEKLRQKGEIYEPKTDHLRAV